MYSQIYHTIKCLDDFNFHVFLLKLISFIEDPGKISNVSLVDLTASVARIHWSVPDSFNIEIHTIQIRVERGDQQVPESQIRIYETCKYMIMETFP